jgi:hypothetical protein
MNKPILIIFSVVFFLSLISSSNQSNALSNIKQITAPAKDVREVVWG